MPSAAALLERILTEGYIPGMARDAGIASTATVDRDSYPIMKVVAPRRFAMPRPEKANGQYRTLLGWEEGEERFVVPHEGDYKNKYEYLRHGGGYVERVLSQSRAMASLVRTMTGGATGDVPSWPPAPRQVVEWSEEAAHRTIPITQEANAVSRWTPSLAAETQAGFLVDEDGLMWPLPPRECMASPTDAGPDEQWNRMSRPTNELSTSGIDHGPAPRFLIRRDGMEWPLPPRGCVGSTSHDISRLTPTKTTLPQPAAASPTRHNYASEVRPGYFIGRLGSPSPGEIRVSPASSSSSTSTDSTLPITTPNGILGLHDACQLRGDIFSDGGPITTGAKAAILAQTSRYSASPERDANAYVRRTGAWSPIVEDDFFYERDESLSPLVSVTLTDDELEEEDEEERRGRSPTPKWSMLWA